ncbi:hypothetical protein ACIP88_33845 [Streptomyces uncialis]|uniref:hypothetical protein n=1 Tax=Streptomyces uncialis TaxID=1048205 RepID=UPI00382C5578
MPRIHQLRRESPADLRVCGLIPSRALVNARSTTGTFTAQRYRPVDASPSAPLQQRAGPGRTSCRPHQAAGTAATRGALLRSVEASRETIAFNPAGRELAQYVVRHAPPHDTEVTSLAEHLGLR